MGSRGCAGLAGLLAILALALAAPAGAVTLPSGFQETPVFEGLQEPTAFRFSPDGRVFVAEKQGKIVVFDGLGDEAPTEFADLAKQVYDLGDRGILGLALDPDFPAKPYVYVLYTFDHVLGVEEDPPGFFPHWGLAENGYANDPCPKPPDADVDDCPVSGRLVRLTAAGDEALPSASAPLEQVLVEGWCQQTSSHSVGDLEFGPEGALFASGGEGASFSTPDYGEVGWPHKNQCDDPPGGEALAPPSAEGGSLRSQDVRTPADPTGLSGTVIRIDPETAEGKADNPFASSPDANARRIIGFGFRNPFRFAINRETREVYVNNVGGGPFEEIDRLATVPSSAYNSGWPCFEADAPNSNFELLGLSLCDSLYAVPGSTSLPFFFYRHAQGVSGEDTCPQGNGSDITGSAFYEGGAFPPSYDNAFFFADSVFGCIYVMFPDADGRPDPSTVAPFLTDGGLYPGVDVQVGPEGDLYYASLFSEGFGPGAIHRISYFSGNQPPVARLTATPEWGAGTLEPTFDASGSTDADHESLSYRWDLDGDGTYDPATAQATRTTTFADTENHTVAVKVSDQQGASRIARVTVFPGDTPPQPTIAAPAESAEVGTASLAWAVGDTIHFAGGATDAEDGGQLPATRLDWNSRLYHCPNGPSGCHAHPLRAFPGVAEGGLIAPDHEYPSRIELKLTATDSRGLSATRAIDVFPRPVNLTIGSDPAGLKLTAGPLSGATPFTLTAIEGSTVTLVAPQTAASGGETYSWRAWSDGGARVHTITARGPVTSYVATYLGARPRQSAPGSPPPADPQTHIAKHPDRRTASRGATFAFRADDDGASFRCKVDRRRYRPCRSPRTYAHLAPGRHVFRVAAVAADGRVDPTPAVFRWRVLR